MTLLRALALLAISTAVACGVRGPPRPPPREQPPPSGPVAPTPEEPDERGEDTEGDDTPPPQDTP